MKNFRQHIRIIFIVAAAFGAAVLAWSIFIEPAQLKYKEYALYLKGWPAELSGFSIVLITDLHAGSPHIGLEKVRDIVEKTNAMHPDLILLGGDYVIQGVIGGKAIPSRDIAAVLSGLHARYGVFGVLGNHDWWDDAQRIRAEFEMRRIEMLEDDARHIPAGARGFWLVGVSDYNEGAHNVAKALAKTTHDSPIILFTHSPDVFPELPGYIALAIAGHTHGGQVYLPFFGRPIIPSKYGQRYAMGPIEENGRQFFVGTGIGTSILPIRFMTPPEVSILKIYPRV